MLKTIGKILLTFIAAFAVTILIVSIKHPIAFKWVSFRADFIGKPIKTSIYLNNVRNVEIKIYSATDTYIDGKLARYFIVKMPDNFSDGRIRYFIIDTLKSFVARSTCYNIDCFDSINGCLLKSDNVGYVEFKDDMKGMGYDSKLEVRKDQIKLLLKTDRSRCDTLEINL